jgi:hypothetical protein
MSVKAAETYPLLPGPCAVFWKKTGVNELQIADVSSMYTYPAHCSEVARFLVLGKGKGQLNCNELDMYT